MNLLPGIARITTATSGLVGTSGKPIRVFGVHSVSMSTASALVMYNGISSANGVPIAQIDGAVLQGVTVNFAGGMRFANGCYVTTADLFLNYATIIYTEEF